MTKEIGSKRDETENKNTKNQLKLEAVNLNIDLGEK